MRGRLVHGWRREAGRARRRRRQTARAREAASGEKGFRGPRLNPSCAALVQRTSVRDPTSACNGQAVAAAEQERRGEARRGAPRVACRGESEGRGGHLVARDGGLIDAHDDVVGVNLLAEPGALEGARAAHERARADGGAGGEAAEDALRADPEGWASGRAEAEREGWGLREARARAVGCPRRAPRWGAGF